MSTTTGKVKFEKIVNARILVTNDSDTEREYAISAEVTVNGKQAENFENGSVNKADGGATVCTFSAWGESNLNVNYNTTDEEVSVSALRAIKAFMANVRDKASENGILKIS